MATTAAVQSVLLHRLAHTTTQPDHSSQDKTTAEGAVTVLAFMHLVALIVTHLTSPATTVFSYITLLVAADLGLITLTDGVASPDPTSGSLIRPHLSIICLILGQTTNSYIIIHVIHILAFQHHLLTLLRLIQLLTTLS